ncbi:MAG TPA: glycosyltransferase, partial [Actinomycetota bacterium]|nr:glycosyltransferase [Actinomycetota bacterium]
RSEDVVLLDAPGASIGRGRNLAIEAATHDTIAVSEADCVLAPDWLEHLARALEAGADVAMGYYRPIATTLFETAAGAIAAPEPHEIDEARFMPSSRSIGFRRDMFERTGGYPEWLETGEDLYLDHRLRDLYADMRFVPQAVAHWHIRPSLGETFRQYFGYAEGDGRAGMYPERHLVRFTAYGALAYAVARRRRPLLAAIAIGGSVYAGRRVRRAFRMLPARPGGRAATAALIPGLMVMVDVAKMAGYVSGLLQKSRS